MAEVKVLIEGYAKRGDVELVTSTTTLIKDGEINIVVDPGMNRPLLTESLKKEGLGFGDINYVILTHTHTDHTLLAALFEKAKVVDAWSIYSFDGEIFPLKNNTIHGTSIKILQTPGHSSSHISIIVEGTNKEKTVIAGDVVWWWDDEEVNTDNEILINQVHKDLYAKDFEDLKESRRKILEIADWIIPGHGKMFKVNK